MMSSALIVSSAGLSSAGMAAVVVVPPAAFVFAVRFVVGVCTHAADNMASAIAAASDTEARMRVFILMCLD